MLLIHVDSYYTHTFDYNQLCIKQEFNTLLQAYITLLHSIEHGAVGLNNNGK